MRDWVKDDGQGAHTVQLGVVICGSAHPKENALEPIIIVFSASVTAATGSVAVAGGRQQVAGGRQQAAGSGQQAAGGRQG